MADTGAIYGLRDEFSGLEYGWNCDMSVAGPRDRYDDHTVASTMIVPDRFNQCPNAIMWSINIGARATLCQVTIGFSDAEDANFYINGCKFNFQCKKDFDLALGSGALCVSECKKDSDLALGSLGSGVSLPLINFSRGVRARD